MVVVISLVQEKNKNKAEEMLAVSFAKVKRSSSSTNTREWVGYRLYFIPIDKM